MASSNATLPDIHDLAADLSRERFALSSLLEFARTLTPDLGPRGIIRSVVRTVMGKSLIKDAFAYLGATDGTYELITHSGFAGEEFPEQIDGVRLDKVLAKGGEDFTAVPLIAADGTGYLGLLGFGKSINPQLSTDSEATYLASLAALTSIALTNAWLFEREKERERLESELRLARDIQQTLLPQRFPEMKGVEFAAVSMPSEWVGGDYYDVVQLDDYRVLLCIADVVGKGVTAALTMSNLQAALRALVFLLRGGHVDLLDIVKELNRLMCESTSPERFITAAFVLLDVNRHSIEYVVCGHPNPMIAYPRSGHAALESTGIPLGIVATYPYETRKHGLENGSAILFYTDGLSEALYQGRMLGQEGIEGLVERPELRTGDLQEALDRLIASPNITIQDDITVLAVRLKSR
jgi:serine phosphatase RsbU (regulator of sigma subunit)